MEHVVFYPAASGVPAFRRVSSLDEAVNFVEHLRNVEGITDFSVHELSPVQLSFRAYYHVQVPAAAVDGSEPVAAPAAEVTEGAEAAEPAAEIAEPAAEAAELSADNEAESAPPVEVVAEVVEPAVMEAPALEV